MTNFLKRFVKAAALFALVMTVSALTAHAYSGNLIMNPGGDEGMNYWMDPDDAWDVDNKEITTLNGVYFWPKKKDLPSTKIYQDIPISNYTGQKLTFSAYTRDYTAGHGDESMIRLELMDMSGTVLSIKEVSNKNNNQWIELKVSEIIPDNAVTARASLVGIRHSGSDLDSYFDEVSLSVSVNTDPIPSTGTSTEQGSLKYLQLQLSKGQKAYLNGVRDKKTSEKIEWKSTNTKVATVSKNGVVTAKSRGTAIIKLKLGNSSLKIRIKVVN